MVDGPIPYEVEYLFWVGCAGAIDDRAKKVTKAVAELLHIAGVEFAVLGSGETCSGDPARRMGNEFVFQQLAMENVETLNAAFEGRVPGTRKIVATCPHCFNSLGREYPQLGGEYEVIHHTQLLGTAGRGGPAHPGHAGRPQGDLPRPVLPRPAQQGLHAPARDPRLRPGPLHPGDAPLQGPRLLLRRRRRAHVDGGEDRQADQRRAHRGGARARSRRHLHRLPVLHHDAQRRAEHQEAERRGQGPRRGPRRQPDPAALDGPGRRPGHRVRSRGRRRRPTTPPAPAPRPRSTARS